MTHKDVIMLPNAAINDDEPVMKDSFLRDVKDRLESLSRSETKVANWILTNPGEAVGASIQAVAKQCSVSEPTVIRFCRSMGLNGYRDLKTHLIASLHKSESYLHHDVSEQDKPATAAVKVLESSISALVNLRKQIFAMPFEEAVESIVGARQIILTGLGASGHVAGDASHKFFRLGVPCVALTDSPTILQQASICRSGDVIIAISHTGTWNELIQAMQIAKSNGATVLAVTDPKSRLAEVATILFPCHADEDTNIYTPMSSRLAQLTVLDALQVSVALKLGDTAEQNMRAAKAALSVGRNLGEEQ